VPRPRTTSNRFHVFGRLDKIEVEPAGAAPGPAKKPGRPQIGEFAVPLRAGGGSAPIGEARLELRAPATVPAAPAANDDD